MRIQNEKCIEVVYGARYCNSIRIVRNIGLDI